MTNYPMWSANFKNAKSNPCTCLGFEIFCMGYITTKFIIFTMRFHRKTIHIRSYKILDEMCGLCHQTGHTDFFFFLVVSHSSCLSLCFIQSMCQIKNICLFKQSELKEKKTDFKLFFFSSSFYKSQSLGIESTKTEQRVRKW